jgi:hypothetical protein
MDGLCPFHNEDTPSFTVYRGGHFHCLGCQAHGSVFDYMMCSESIDFRQACERVAIEAAIMPQTNSYGNGEHKDEGWLPILPLPRDAPKPTDKQFRCDMLHEYWDCEDRLLFYVRRHERKATRDKQFYPLTYGLLNGKARLGQSRKLTLPLR